jgi:hypothetical protein
MNKMTTELETTVLRLNRKPADNMVIKYWGFKWYAKCVEHWQGSYPLIGSLLRNPQHFIQPTTYIL